MRVFYQRTFENVKAAVSFSLGRAMALKFLPGSGVHRDSGTGANRHQQAHFEVGMTRERATETAQIRNRTADYRNENLFLKLSSCLRSLHVDKYSEGI